MKKLTTDEFIKKAKLVHGDKYDYSLFVYNGAKIKGTIICKNHGKFLQCSNDHLNGVGCPACGIEKRTILISSNLEKFINHSKLIHKNKLHSPKNGYDYSKSIYVNNYTKTTIICPIHGEFLQTPHQHLGGKGCLKCWLNYLSINRLNNTQFFIKKSQKIHKNVYDYSQSNYIGSGEKIKIICPKHGPFYQTAGHHTNGSGCQKCVNVISKPETEFLDYLHIPNTKENRQKRINLFRIDGFDSKTNTIYEFLGDYWHGNPKKFNHNDINTHAKKTFGELYQFTLNKFKILKENGYTIKYIWWSDWNDWSKNKMGNIPIIKY